MRPCLYLYQYLSQVIQVQTILRVISYISDVTKILVVIYFGAAAEANFQVSKQKEIDKLCWRIKSPVWMEHPHNETFQGGNDD